MPVSVAPSVLKTVRAVQSQLPITLQISIKNFARVAENVQRFAQIIASFSKLKSKERYSQNCNALFYFSSIIISIPFFTETVASLPTNSLLTPRGTLFVSVAFETP